MSSDYLLPFCMGNPRLARWLRLWKWVDNCVGKHGQACWLLSCMGTNAQAAIPGVIDCLEHCPTLHFMDRLELLDTLGDISATNPAAIPYLPSAPAGVTCGLPPGPITSMVEPTCWLRLANGWRRPIRGLLGGQELFWFREDHALNRISRSFAGEHVCRPTAEVPLPGYRSSSNLQSRSNDAIAAIARLLAMQTNAPVRAEIAPRGSLNSVRLGGRSRCWAFRSCAALRPVATPVAVGLSKEVATPRGLRPSCRGMPQRRN